MPATLVHSDWAAYGPWQGEIPGVSASRKLGRADAAGLAKKTSRVVVAKGKQVSAFAPAGKAPENGVDAMLGPTGNLRAPCLVMERTILVGFDEAVYEFVFG